MKTIVRNIALAVAAMGLTVACNNNKPAEETIDTTPAPVEEVVEEKVVEEAPAEVVEAVQEAPAKATTPAKKTTPKAEVKVNNDEGGVSVSAGDTKVEVNSGKLEVKTNADGTVAAKPRRR